MALPAPGPRDPWIVLAVGAVALLVVGWLAWRAEFGTVTLPDRPPGFDRADSHFTPDEARAFRAFPLLWLGPRFDGLDLRSIQVLHDGTPQGEAAALRRGPITFTYHDRHDCRRPANGETFTCEGRLVSVRTQVMCAPGLRYPGPEVRDLRVAGVSAAVTERGLEVYTGRVTAILSAAYWAEALFAAEALRRIDGAGAGRLAPPDPEHPRVRGVPCRDRR